MKTNSSGFHQKLLAGGMIAGTLCGACVSTAYAADATWLGGDSSDWGKAGRQQA